MSPSARRKSHRGSSRFAAPCSASNSQRITAAGDQSLIAGHYNGQFSHQHAPYGRMHPPVITFESCVPVGPWRSWERASMASRRSWVRIPSAPPKLDPTRFSILNLRFQNGAYNTAVTQTHFGRRASGRSPSLSRRLSLPSHPRDAPQTFRSIRIFEHPAHARYPRKKRQDRVRSRLSKSEHNGDLRPLPLPPHGLFALLVRQAKDQPADPHVIAATPSTSIE